MCLPARPQEPTNDASRTLYRVPASPSVPQHPVNGEHWRHVHRQTSAAYSPGGMPPQNTSKCVNSGTTTRQIHATSNGWPPVPCNEVQLSLTWVPLAPRYNFPRPVAECTLQTSQSGNESCWCFQGNGRHGGSDATTVGGVARHSALIHKLHYPSLQPHLPDLSGNAHRTPPAPCPAARNLGYCPRTEDTH